ncbi:hypothetical protein B0J12DRAFT_362985 [Macrophomina phaseolina]|uniref:Uncharacterized protein n=1 Tax=Macrophomina phaseolina TaxID=35725 RepID=A0ABQ8FTU1_9PEZI|nr:hypothetical protein B0J12DRAFT_362985 [Macrophomina phaseolina]
MEYGVWKLPYGLTYSITLWIESLETAIRKIEGAAKKIMTDLERVEALHRRWKEDQEMQVLKRAGDVSKIGSQSVKGKQELGNMIKADEQASESTKGSVVDPLRFQRVRRSARSSGGRSVGDILSNSTAQQGEWGKAARGNDTGKEAHSVAEAQRYVGRAAPRVSSEDTTETESYCGSEDGLAYEGHRPTAIILDTATDKSDPVEDAAVQAQAQESRRLPHPELPGKNSGVMSGGSEDESPEGEGQPGPGGRMHERYGWVPESIELSATQANTEVDADCTPESGLVEGTDMDSEL